MLQQEIESGQRFVRTDAYQMSIGEIVSMYKDKEININPEFQRLFRWTPQQKSKLIESLLLGIPIPSIFVFETDDSKWELIDGLQRISTILEFMGLLDNPATNKRYDPSILEGTVYLPSLSNVVWEKSPLVGVPQSDQNELEKPLQLSLRRSRLTIEILKRPSSDRTKYDLFQRLNAGGTQANPQELRNCIIIMANPKFYRHLKILADDGLFQKVLGLTSEQIEKQKHLEYASRFLVYSFSKYENNLDVEEFIDKAIVDLALYDNFTQMEKVFKTTFELLFNAFGAKSLKKNPSGAGGAKIGLPAIESIAAGIAENVEKITRKKDPIKYVQERINAFWKCPDIEPFFIPGLRGTTRIQRTIPFGKKWFST